MGTFRKGGDERSARVVLMWLNEEVTRRYEKEIKRGLVLETGGTCGSRRKGEMKREAF